MIDTNELNKYSNKVYDYILKNNSELIKNISIAPSDFGKNYIFVEIISNNKNSCSNLYLSSENNELTVGFHDYHCHFDSFDELVFEKEIKIALEYFYNILNEKLFVVSAGGITTLLTNEQIISLENGQKIEGFDYDCISYYVTSWSGKIDRIFENPR